ncbi:energy-coupling factor transporter ATP-binding protein EcfA2 [Streptacidiphilus sp. MAP5-52]
MPRPEVLHPDALSSAVPRPDALSPPVLRPALVELRLGAFKSFRDAVLPLRRVTLLHGPSGAGKSNALEALRVLASLAEGEDADEALALVRGGVAGCLPFGADTVRLGCSVAAAVGEVRLDVSFQRVGGTVLLTSERLTAGGRLLLTTGALDASSSRIDAAWHSDGRQGDIRAPLGAHGLVTAQLPLRVAGATPGERLVLAAAEAVLTALRESFALEPVPVAMREWVRADDDARLRGSAENLSAVIARIEGECRIRFGKLVQATRAMSPVLVSGLGALRSTAADGTTRVCAALQLGDGRRLGAELLPSGVLRQLAFATVLLTGPGVLQMSPAMEVPDAERLLTVLGEGLDLGLGAAQVESLLRLAVEVASRGHVRLLATATERAVVPGVFPVRCAVDPASGRSELVPEDAPVSAPVDHPAVPVG